MSTSRKLHVAAVQSPLSDDRDANVAAMTEMVRQAAGDGADVILLPELFEGHYFPRRQSDAEFARARPLRGNPTIEHFASLAAELGVCLPISFFERAGQSHYNSAAIIDRRGEVLGVYRKSHIPDGPGYQEKFYFRPGDTGFATWPIDGGDPDAPTIGVAVCWDQWFPEAARLTALCGARLLVYPTAIGWQFDEGPEVDAAQHDAWETIQRGHAIANGLFVVAVNRVGQEGEIRFWGQSFVADPFGRVLARASSCDEETLVVDCDPALVERVRRNWPFLRDRRIDAYGDLVRRVRD